MIDQNWRDIFLRAYSAWALYSIIVIAIAPDAIYLLTGVDTNPQTWNALLLWTALLGLIGRVIVQPKRDMWKRRVALILIVLITVLLASPGIAQTTEQQTMRVLEPLVIKWEGEHRCRDDPLMHCAYLDLVGVPTICYGETRDVRIGQRATDDECGRMLRHRLTDDFRDGLHGYFTPTTITLRLTPERDAAYVSLAYNVGIRGAGRSTATRRLNNGDIRGGCYAIGWWNKAGGRVVRGLVRRRAEEVNLCLMGL